MSLLFDISPSDDHKKSRKPRPAAAEAAAPEQEPSVQSPPALLSIIGLVDKDVACLDESCASECHDIIDSDRGWWRLECRLCGTGQWIPAIDGRLEERKSAPRTGAFTFPDGRHAGKTVEEVAARRMDYVVWAAKHDRDEETRKACEFWLASNPAAL
jgi:hypothetical protein